MPLTTRYTQESRDVLQILHEEFLSFRNSKGGWLIKRRGLTRANSEGVKPPKSLRMHMDTKRNEDVPRLKVQGLPCGNQRMSVKRSYLRVTKLEAMVKLTL